MARIIVLHTDVAGDKLWAEQFVAANKRVRDEAAKRGHVVLERGRVQIPKRVTFEQYHAGFRNAADQADKGGVLLLFGGHSGAECQARDRCDLAGRKNAVLTLDPDKTLEFDDRTIFYDVKALPADSDTPASADAKIIADPARKKAAAGQDEIRRALLRQQRRKNYDALGGTLKACVIQRVVFLSCNLGNADLFVDKIARDWHVQVGAYRPLTVVEHTRGTAGQVARLFLQGREPRTADERADSEIYIPPLDNGDAYLSPRP
jgi:hypothetical protein